MGRSRRGFTLVELAIVIAILGLIAVVAFPRFQDMVREAQSSTCAGVRAAITEAEIIREMRLHIYPTSLSLLPTPDKLKTDGFLTSDSSVVCPAGGELYWTSSTNLPNDTSWWLACSIHGH